MASKFQLLTNNSGWLHSSIVDIVGMSSVCWGRDGVRMKYLYGAWMVEKMLTNNGTLGSGG